MGLRSSINCPPSSMQCQYLWPNQKEGDGSQKLNQLLSFIHAMLPINSANICGPIKRRASRNQHVDTFQPSIYK
ncbi:hypothetical protein MUK42_12019 [Musa troglodytarum]|uniref:Uncharacterized protein n=1 Tax=Musa troglodytarum TaxID=320322 RepID=A0A9E7H793_9LILI|nr:hypothetical protein MUK42_12019 [Musa troglodytarum]